MMLYLWPAFPRTQEAVLAYYQGGCTGLVLNLHLLTRMWVSTMNCVLWPHGIDIIPFSADNFFIFILNYVYLWYLWVF